MDPLVKLLEYLAYWLLLAGHFLHLGFGRLRRRPAKSQSVSMAADRPSIAAAIVVSLPSTGEIAGNVRSRSHHYRSRSQRTDLCCLSRHGGLAGARPGGAGARRRGPWA